MGKKLFGPRTNEFIDNLGLLILRVGAGGCMLTHGIQKLLLLFGDKQIVFPDPLGVGATISLILAILAEFFCSILVLLGIITRLACIPLIVTMSIAVFVVQKNAAFANRELGILYLILFVFILIFGSGRFAIGRLFKGN